MAGASPEQQDDDGSQFRIFKGFYRFNAALVTIKIVFSISSPFFFSFLVLVFIEFIHWAGFFFQVYIPVLCVC